MFWALNHPEIGTHLFPGFYSLHSFYQGINHWLECYTGLSFQKITILSQGVEILIVRKLQNTLSELIYLDLQTQVCSMSTSFLFFFAQGLNWKLQISRGEMAENFSDSEKFFRVLKNRRGFQILLILFDLSNFQTVFSSNSHRIGSLYRGVSRKVNTCRDVIDCFLDRN